MENKSLNYWKGFSFILIALNITLIIFLFMKPMSGRPPEQKEAETVDKFIIKELKFDKKQEAVFLHLRKIHHEYEIQLHDSLKIVKRSFYDLLSSENTERADNLAQKIGNIERDRVLNTLVHFEQVKKICSPEQKIIFNRIIGDVLRKMAPPPPPRRF